jgi:hypothetical protein
MTQNLRLYGTDSQVVDNQWSGEGIEPSFLLVAASSCAIPTHWIGGQAGTITKQLLFYCPGSTR